MTSNRPTCWPIFSEEDDSWILKMFPSQSPQEETTARRSASKKYQNRRLLKKVSPKSELPTQKVSPPVAPLLPAPMAQELHLEFEEEGTTLEAADIAKLVVILPGGEQRTVIFHGKLPENFTVQDLLKKLLNDSQPNLDAETVEYAPESNEEEQSENQQ